MEFPRIRFIFQQADKLIHAGIGDRLYSLKRIAAKRSSGSWHWYDGNVNRGDPLRFAALCENWKDGRRQSASKAYDLSKANVFTNSTVERVLIDISSRTATGIELLDGRIFQAKKEALCCCGDIKTPQLLMLFGIGPAKHDSNGLSTVEDLPVGESLHDHLSTTMYFKLKNPEPGLVIGSALFNEKASDFTKGNPVSWIATLFISEASQAAFVDGIPENDPFIFKSRRHVEFFISYAPVAAPAFFKHSLAGIHISTLMLGLLPRSRGSVTLSSTRMWRSRTGRRSWRRDLCETTSRKSMCMCHGRIFQQCRALGW